MDKPSSAGPDGSPLDRFDTPLAFAALDGTIEVANRAFRAWTQSDASTLGGALGVALPALAGVLTAARPHIIQATARTPRGRTMQVEYHLRLATYAGVEAIVVEGRDLSRVFEKEAMLQAFARTIEVNNRLLTHQKSEIAKLLDDVNAAYAAAQRLLDASDQGFVTLDRSARLLAGRSTAFDRWFASPPVGTPFVDCLQRLHPDLALLFELLWGQLEADVLPVAIVIEMLPAEVRSQGRCYRLAYTPEVDPAGTFVTMLVVISDVTDEIERERAEAQQSELSNLLARFSSDRSGFVQFVAEADALMATVTAPGSGRLELLRALHTLKGNCGLFGAQAIATRCHELEDHIADCGEAVLEDERNALGEDWRALRRRIGVFLEHGGDGVWIARNELDALHDRIAAMSTDEIRRALETWTWESANRRLGRVAAQVRELGVRLHRGPIDVVVEGGNLRFDPDYWGPFWISLVHLVLNCVDHGVEPAEERVAAGKSNRARVTLRARLVEREVVLEIGDDGRGVDWRAVARAAGARGLDNSSNAALVRALFVDGMTTRTEVDSQSGRGVGLAAVHAACDRLGGAIEVDSEPGQGTTFRFRFAAVRVAASQEAEPVAQRSVA